MSDLIQYLQEGFRDPGETEIRWANSVLKHPADGAGRLRIIDRERANGFTPGDDGWLHYWRDLGDLEHHHRIRWEDAKWVVL